MALLESKNAVVYGGAGLIGGAIATGFAAEGARVHLVGRTVGTLERKAAEITAGGGDAEVAVLDAYDAAAVDAHAGEVAERYGSLDVSVNVVNHGDVQGKPMTEMKVEDYLAPVANGVTTSFMRVCSIKTGGIGESIPADFEGREELVESLVEPTMLGRLATARDVADAAVFLASDRARAMTAATVNVSSGAIPDA